MDLPWQLPPLPSHHDKSSYDLTRINSRLNSSISSFDQQKAQLDKGRPTFGVDLTEQMIRDAVEVPRIVEKCCEAIEKYGLDLVGIYRISGTTSKIQKLKAALDRGALCGSSGLDSHADINPPDIEAVNLHSEEWSSDINNVTSALKLWLRELPEPLLSFSLYQGFVDAASTYMGVHLGHVCVNSPLEF